jgi:hypothetical protein
MEKKSGRISEGENQEFLSRRRIRNLYEHPKITKIKQISKSKKNKKNYNEIKQFIWPKDPHCCHI